MGGSTSQEQSLHGEALQLARLTGQVDLKNKDLKAIPTNLLDEECDWMKAIDISDNEVRILPEDLVRTWPNVTEINVCNNEISAIGPLPNSLVALRASNNNITEAPPTEFSQHLRSLDLSANKIQAVGSRLAVSLEEVDLSRNSIAHVSPDAFAGLTSLRVLNLRSNDLPELPQCLASCKALVNLKAGGNPLTEGLPECITLLPVLSDVELRSADLGEIPPQLEFCKALVGVDLSNNGITFDDGGRKPGDRRGPTGRAVSQSRLGRAISHLPAATSPKAAANKTSFASNPAASPKGGPAGSRPILGADAIESGGGRRDPQMARLAHVRDVVFDYNPVAALPPTIRLLAAVRHLSLRGMGLTDSSLPREFFDMTWIVKLDLQDNSIENMSPDFVFMTGLRSLNLSENKMESLPKEIGQMTWLTTLDVRNNGMVYLPVEMGGMSGLRHLHIDHNKVSSLPFELGRVVDLEEITFVKCPLEEPPPHMFNLGIKIVLEYMRNRKQRSSHLMAGALGAVTGQSGTQLMHDWKGRLMPSDVPNLSFPGTPGGLPKGMPDMPRFPSADHIKPPGLFSQLKAKLGLFGARNEIVGHGHAGPDPAGGFDSEEERFPEGFHEKKGVRISDGAVIRAAGVGDSDSDDDSGSGSGSDGDKPAK